MKSSGITGIIEQDRFASQNDRRLFCFFSLVAVISGSLFLQNFSDTATHRHAFDAALSVVLQPSGQTDGGNWSDASQSPCEPVCKRLASRRHTRTASLGGADLICQEKYWLTAAALPPEYFFSNLNCNLLHCKNCLFVRAGPGVDLY